MIFLCSESINYPKTETLSKIKRELRIFHKNFEKIKKFHKNNRKNQ